MKDCLRCKGGKMILDEDIYGKGLLCLMCGHRIDLSPLDWTGDEGQKTWPPVGRQREGLRIGGVKL